MHQRFSITYVEVRDMSVSAVLSWHNAVFSKFGLNATPRTNNECFPKTSWDAGNLDVSPKRPRVTPQGDLEGKPHITSYVVAKAVSHHTARHRRHLPVKSSGFNHDHGTKTPGPRDLLIVMFNFHISLPRGPRLQGGM